MPWLTQDLGRLDRFRRGDCEVLTETYKVYCRGVARFLTRGFTFSADDRYLRFHGVSTPFDLEDLVQETFVRAFGESARRAFDGENPFGAWLTTIARNLVIDRWRRMHREARLFSDVKAVADSASPDTASDNHASQTVSLGELDTSARASSIAHVDREFRDPFARHIPIHVVSPSAEESLMARELKTLYDRFLVTLPPDLRHLWDLRFEEGATRTIISEQTGLSAMQVRGREEKLRARFMSFFDTCGFEFDARKGLKK